MDKHFWQDLGAILVMALMFAVIIGIDRYTP